MKHIAVLCFAGLIASLVAATSPVRAQSLPPPEIRGFWVDGFHPGIKSLAEVDALIARAQRAHANAIFAQVRRRGDALYASRYEPRARDIAPGFDPLRTLIERAHQARPRISVHAWINMASVGDPASLPGHVLARHPDWRSLSDTGVGDDQEAIKIDPGVPAAAEWTSRVYLDVARSYDVDGIHFDFVRYGGAHWGYAPASVARFNARWGRTGQPAWDDPLWQQWRRDQVTALVRRVYANAVAVRPRLIVSAALIAWGEGPKSEEDWRQTSAYRAVFQDWRAWLEEGILDLACPMTYFALPTQRAMQEGWAEWIKGHQYGRAATVAVAIYRNTLSDTLDLVRINQAPGQTGGKAAGVLLYSYAGTGAAVSPGGERVPEWYNETVYDTLAQVFPGDAPFPDFPWKVQPATGMVKGTVLSGTGLAWADGVEVTLEGSGGLKRAQTAGGTGFFAFVDLAPGAYTVRVTHGGETSVPRTVEVAPGQTATADFLLAGGDLPEPRLVEGIRREPGGARVLLPARIVTVGMDVLGDRFVVVDAIGGTPLVVRAPADLILPIVRDDLVTITGTLRAEGGNKSLAADAVQVVGSRPW